MKSMLRYNFVILESIAIVFALIAIFTCSWETVALKDTDALQLVHQSPMLLSMIIDHGKMNIDFENDTGYLVELRTGLIEICIQVQKPDRNEFEPAICRKSIVRPSIGLSIIAVIFLFIASFCTIFSSEDDLEQQKNIFLSFLSALFVALGGLLLLTAHWTYSINSELRFPTLYVHYGFSTYFLITAALISLLSMSLILWRLFLLRVFYNQQIPSSSTKQKSKKKSRHHRQRR